MSSLSLTNPTSDADLNGVLNALVAGVQSILGDNLIAAYLQGSFAVGDWDRHSDVDFLIVTGQDITEADLPALQALHRRLHALSSPWAQHLEGSYFPHALLKRPDPAKTPLWYLDNGSQELLRSDHDNDLVVRWVVREHGITLTGPAPHTLIDPVITDDLKREVRATMEQWAHQMSANPDEINNRWYQPFVVLSYCRMLHTLQTGTIKSKRAGAEWAQGALDSRWLGLIQRAWEERPDPSTKVRQEADPADLESTRQFVRYALDKSQEQDDRVT